MIFKFLGKLKFFVIPIFLVFSFSSCVYKNPISGSNNFHYLVSKLVADSVSKIKKNISQVNGYYDTLNKMMINKTNEIKKFLFYVDNKITDKSEVLKEIKSDDSIFSNINEDIIISLFFAAISKK